MPSFQPITISSSIRPVLCLLVGKTFSHSPHILNIHKMLLLLYPLNYFILLDAYFFKRHGHINLDIAATFILIVISIFSIVIDAKDLYGQYGINLYSVTFPTILLYCFQWTMILQARYTHNWGYTNYPGAHTNILFWSNKKEPKEPLGRRRFKTIVSYCNQRVHNSSNKTAAYQWCEEF